ncbi:MAG TPA: hypothetical protein VN672_07745 [Solirubrobacteraceae bacterium]|nr:hypothetical protein [Solirubrobacteraceae bacterium]
MRHLRLGLGLLATMCAFAFGAAPALAHEFISSTTNATHGISESEQLFKLGAIKMKCAKTSAKGSVAAGSSQTYTTAIKFSKCLTTAKVGTHTIFLATRFLTPLTVEYHANGYVVIPEGSGEVKVNTGKTEEFEKSECHIRWLGQTIPAKAVKNPEEEFTAATFSNTAIPKKVSKAFPDGLQHGIEINNAFTGIKYELEGEPCEEWGKEEGPEGGGGTYFGSFPQFVTGGNLEYL